MKVITFSRSFPKGHPRAGEPTYFVEKILNKYFSNAGGWCNNQVEKAVANYTRIMGHINNPNHYAAKVHTVRAGNRWKAGEWFSPRVWGNDINPKSGKSGPYQSKQIEFAPPIMIEKVWPITIYPDAEHKFVIHIKDRYVADWEGTANITQKELAANDGLTKADFLSWFKLDKEIIKPFSGQIICWSNKIQY